MKSKKSAYVSGCIRPEIHLEVNKTQAGEWPEMTESEIALPDRCGGRGCQQKLGITGTFAIPW